MSCGPAPGNSAQLIRYRFDEATITELLALRWWDWDAERLTRHVRAICGQDLAALRSAASS